MASIAIILFHVVNAGIGKFAIIAREHEDFCIEFVESRGF